MSETRHAKQRESGPYTVKPNTVTVGTRSSFPSQTENLLFKKAVLASVVLHLFMFWFGFPFKLTGKESIKTQRQRVKIRRLELPPPEAKRMLEKQTIRETRKRLVLIPTEDPDALEPIQAPIINLEHELPPDNEFYVPPEEPPEPRTPGGDIAPPVQLSSCFQNIVYTELARALRVEGTVFLRAVISKTGVVGEVSILRGLERSLDERAVSALQRCRFKPGFSRTTGQAVDVVYTLTVNFRLTH